MEIYDIAMLVVLLGATIFGAVKGFAWQLASIASIAVSYTVAYKYREPFSQSIHAEEPWNRFLAMLILFIGTSLLIWVAFRMVSGTIDRLKLREFDRQIGALFGLAKGALYCVLITLFAVTLMGDRVRAKVVQSKSGLYIAKVLDQSGAVIPPEAHDVVKPYLNRFDEQFKQPSDSDGSHPVPWMTGAASSGNPSSEPATAPWNNNWNSMPSGVSPLSPQGWGVQAGTAPGQEPNAGPVGGSWYTPQQQAQQPAWNGMQR